MKRIALVLMIITVMLVSSCTSTEGNRFQAKDRTEALLEALAANPANEKGRDSSIPQPERVVPRVVNTHHEEEETAAEAPVEEEIALSEEVVEPDIEEPQEIVEEEVTVTPPETTAVLEEEPLEPEEEETVLYTFSDDVPVIEKTESPADSSAIVPVSDNSESSAMRTLPAENAEDDSSEGLMSEPMQPWMLKLMIALIIDIVLFTAASAIRNAARVPLTAVVSIAIALLMTVLMIVLSTIIAGWSAVWLSYLLLLFTYFILRSGARRRGSL